MSSLKSLGGRIERLEQVQGINKPTVILIVRFINPDMTEIALTPEEETALKSHREKCRRERKSIHVILWTPEEGQRLIAQPSGQDTSSEPTLLGEKEIKA